MTTLPAAATREQFGAIRRDEVALQPVLAAVCARCGVVAGDAKRYTDGSLPVYAFEERVLKIYPPCFPGEADVERAALELVAGRLVIPTPRVEAYGEVDGWQYVLMTRLRGQSLAHRWPQIAPHNRVHMMHILGEALRTMHGLPAGQLSVPPASWSDFIAEQRATARARQDQHGLPTAWLEQIDDFLARTPLVAGGQSLLHTEIMREHLLVERRDDGWALCGFFDFEAMRGNAEYDFASLGVFVTGGDRALLREVLLAYGIAPSACDAARSQRFLAYALLHRYSKLPWYFERIPVAADVTTLDALAEAWFGCAA
jgi:hygromycin-B 7''-O-kinase